MNSSTKKTKNIALYGILIAIILIMAFTPLGYLKIGIVSITFIMIPVSIGAVVLGPTGGAVLGFVFGLTSFLQCFGADAFGSTLFAINPFFTALMCFLPRILMGCLCGLIFKAVSKIDKTRIISYIVANLAAPIMNTVFFVGTLLLFFGNSDYLSQFGNSIWEIASVLITFNALLEIICCFVVGSVLSKSITYLLAKAK